jgi:hypothetical protein
MKLQYILVDAPHLDCAKLYSTLILPAVSRMREANIPMLEDWNLLPCIAVDTAFLVVAGRCTSLSLVVLVDAHYLHSVLSIHLSILPVLKDASFLPVSAERC